MVLAAEHCSPLALECAKNRLSQMKMKSPEGPSASRQCFRC